MSEDGAFAARLEGSHGEQTGVSSTDSVCISDSVCVSDSVDVPEKVCVSNSVCVADGDCVSSGECNVSVPAFDDLSVCVDDKGVYGMYPEGVYNRMGGNSTRKEEEQVDDGRSGDRWSVDWEDCVVEDCRYVHDVISMAADVSETMICGDCNEVYESAFRVTEKFDSACSRCMSGAPGRIRPVAVNHNIVINGFNASQSSVTDVGVNGDDKTEYYVDSMPRDLALLCANDYVEKGAAILMHEDGVVVELSSEQMCRLRVFIKECNVVKRLRVKNRTYEVVPTDSDVAYASTNYFNTKVNVNTNEERVLSYLLTGLTLRDIQDAISNGSITGFHPEMKRKQLSNFEGKWGRTPDVLQMAYPNKLGNVKGYMSEPHVYTFVGERVEIDFMECDFNEDSIGTPSPTESNSVFRKKVRKLASFGGAIAAWVAYDVYSGFVYGKLVTSVAKSVECVKELVEFYEKHGHKVHEIAADRGIVTEGKFRITTPETIAYCSSKGIRTKGAEPYNHSNGTPHVERVIQVVENMIRMGTHYMLQNPNLQYLKYSKKDILMLWGELFLWSMVVISLKSSPKNPKVSRHFLFYRVVPNIQDIRLLPIFAVLLVYRHVPSSSSLDGANRPFYMHGLYVGPDMMVTGAIRVAVKVGSTMQIIVSTKYKCVTDGGSVNLHHTVQRGLRGLLEGGQVQEAEVVADGTPAAMPVLVPSPVNNDSVAPVVSVSEVSSVESTADKVSSVSVSNDSVTSVSVSELRGDVHETPSQVPEKLLSQRKKKAKSRAQTKARNARARATVSVSVSESVCRNQKKRKNCIEKSGVAGRNGMLRVINAVKSLITLYLCLNVCQMI